MPLYYATTELTDLRSGNENVLLCLCGGLPVFVSPDLPSVENEGPTMDYRINDDGSQQWFEVGFSHGTDITLTGNATAGWIDSTGFWRFDIEQTEDLQAWNYGKLIDCGPPEVMPDGTTEYWARCTNPIDSKVKTGFLTAAYDNVFHPPYGTMNPITNITLGGVVQALANYPYDMLDAGERAQLVTDMEALGWENVTVIGVGTTGWEMTIPGVYQEEYQLVNQFYWPGFYVPDMWGNLVNWSGSNGFGGVWVNAQGVTILPRQFCRLKIIPLKEI